MVTQTPSRERHLGRGRTSPLSMLRNIPEEIAAQLRDSIQPERRRVILGMVRTGSSPAEVAAKINIGRNTVFADLAAMARDPRLYRGDHAQILEAASNHPSDILPFQREATIQSKDNSQIATETPGEKPKKKAKIDVPQEVVVKAIEGDYDAKTQIIAAAQAPLFHHAYRMLRDYHRAEEIAAGTLLNFLERLEKKPPLPADSSINSYLFRICTNRSLDEIRRRGLVRWEPLNMVTTFSSPNDAFQQPTVYETVETTDPLDSPDIAFRRNNSKVIIERALAQLKPDQKLALQMLSEEFSLEEISDKLGISRLATKSQIFRAKIDLLYQIVTQNANSLLPGLDENAPRSLAQKVIEHASEGKTIRQLAAELGTKVGKIRKELSDLRSFVGAALDL